MLRIRPEQIEVFERDARARFVERAARHLATVHPTVGEGLDEAGRRAFAEAALAKAAAHGMTTERDAIVVLDVMALLGRDFDQDPALAEVHAPLTDEGVAAAHRAEELWRRTRAHLERGTAS
jgi:hypothetical protein